jgi:uncharacterized RDD family membrane protein YckC
MAGAMKYMVRTGDGSEYGPVDQEALVQWAKAGRITSEAEVRNALMQKWNPADKLPFLKEIIENQANAGSGDTSVKSKLSNLVNPEAEGSKGGVFKYTAATIQLRFSAWVTDTLILLLIGAGILIAASSLIQGGANSKVIFTIATLAFVFCILMYYTVLLGFTAQTVGQMFWGIMVVRSQGEPVLMGRALVFSVFYLIFFWTTLVFAFSLPSKRGLQDLLSGVRVVKINTA